MTPPRPGGRSRCRIPRRPSTEACRALGASRSSLLASSPPVAKAEGADPKRASRDASKRANSSRNRGRNHLGTPSEIKSEWWARSSRNPGRLPPESAVPELESAGVVVRMPVSWRASRPARPQVTATVGSRVPSAIGLDGLLDFQMGVMLDGEPLTEAEVATLLAGTENLVLLRGQWVEVDRARLQRTMEQFQAAEALAARDALTFAETMRVMAAAAVTRTNQA